MDVKRRIRERDSATHMQRLVRGHLGRQKVERIRLKIKNQYLKTLIYSNNVFGIKSLDSLCLFGLHDANPLVHKARHCRILPFNDQLVVGL